MKKILLFIIFIFTHNAYAQSSIFANHMGGWINDYMADIDKIEGGCIITSQYDKQMYKINDDGRIDWRMVEIAFPAEYLFLSTEVYNNDIYTLVYAPDYSPSYNIFGFIFYPGINIVKINSSGNVIWVKNIPNPDNYRAKILIENNSIYVQGQYNGTLNVENKYFFESQLYWDCVSKRYRQGSDNYIAKYDLDGNLIHMISFGSVYPDVHLDSSVDTNGNIYFLGFTDYGVPKCIEPKSFIAQFDSNLNRIWKNIFLYDDGFLSTNIQIAKNNKVYVWGNYQGTVDHDNIHLDYSSCIDPKMTIYASSALLEFDALSGNYIRNKPFCTNTTSQYITDFHISKGFMVNYDENSMIIHTSFRNALQFNNGIHEPYFDFVKRDKYFENLLLFKIDLETLNADFLASFSGNENDYFISDRAGEIDLDGNTLYLAGMYQENPINILGTNLSNNSGNGDFDILYAKINFDNLLSVDSEIKIDDEKFQVFPNPTNDLLSIHSEKSITKILVYNTLGQLIKKYYPIDNHIRIKDLQTGIYHFQFYNDDNIIFSKKIIRN